MNEEKIGVTDVSDDSVIYQRILRDFMTIRNCAMKYEDYIKHFTYFQLESYIIFKTASPSRLINHDTYTEISKMWDMFLMYIEDYTIPENYHELAFTAKKNNDLYTYKIGPFKVSVQNLIDKNRLSIFYNDGNIGIELKSSTTRNDRFHEITFLSNNSNDFSDCRSLRVTYDVESLNVPADIKSDPVIESIYGYFLDNLSNF